jgi:hypothetical protein
VVGIYWRIDQIHIKLYYQKSVNNIGYSVKDMAIIQGEEINPHSLNREDGLKLLGREPLTV